MVVRINNTAILVLSVSPEGEGFIKSLAKQRNLAVSACMRELIEAGLDAQGVPHPVLGRRGVPARKCAPLRGQYLDRYMAGETSVSLAKELGITLESFHTLMQSARRDRGEAMNSVVSVRHAEQMRLVLSDPFFPISARTREIAEAFVLYKNQQLTAEAMGVSRQRVDQVVFALTRDHRKQRKAVQAIEGSL